MSAWSAQTGLANAAILAVFGQAVSYQQGAGDPFVVTGVPDKRTEEQRNPDSPYLRLFVQLSDFAVAPARGDQVTVDGADYTVFDLQADSSGGCWLFLRG